MAFLLRYAQSPASKANAIKALRRHFRDFRGQGQTIEGFKIPKTEPSMMILPSKEELKGFHDFLGLKHQALFLLLASSGIRKGEVLFLEAGQVDLEKQVLIPNAHAGRTKRNWYGFFNEEAKGRLEDYLASRKGGKRKLFPMWMPGFKREWARASEESGGQGHSQSPPLLVRQRDGPPGRARSLHRRLPGQDPPLCPGEALHRLQPGKPQGDL
jgi:integrase